MREIKFRAWDKLNRRMVEVTDITTNSDGVVDLVWVKDAPDKNARTLSFDDSGFTFELMQFTGLCDKDGRDIYEGDIVRITWKAGYDDSRSAIGVVIFTDGAFCIEGQFGNYYCWTAYEVEVLGNIYENPSLLEQIRNSDGPK